MPTSEWVAAERSRIRAGDLIQPLKDMYAESMKLSPRWAAEFRGFWDLDEDFELSDAVTPTVAVAKAAKGKIAPAESVASYLAECRSQSFGEPLPTGTGTHPPRRSLSSDTLEALLDERLARREVKDIQSGFKNPDRFDQWIALLQSRVPWDEQLVLPLGEGLYVVRIAAGEYGIRTEAGTDLCDWRENWKLHARVFVRKTLDDLREIYPERAHCDPDWMELREYYDPADGTLLEVEALPPGYPVVHEFLPDLEGFYAGWLGRELP